MDNSQHKPPEGAQKALIEAALTLFGRDGFAGTSTRDLAAKAGVNISLIAYHFGGKEGLRLACGREVARRMALAATLPAPPANLSPEQALDRLDKLLRMIVQFICTSRQAEQMLGFMIHEVITGGPVLDAIYDSFISAKHSEVAALWARVSGLSPDSEHVRLSVFALIGQIAYFRLGRHVVIRKMGWNDIGSAEASRIADLICGNLRLMIKGERS